MLTYLAMRPPARQRGMSLVEVAVAAAVLLCVVTGSLSLLTAVSRRSADSDHQVAAAALALEIVERMRLNRDAAAAGDYDTPRAAPMDGAAQSMVQTDLQAWQAELSRRLPQGAGTVATQSASGVVTVAVVVTWSAPAAQPGQPASQEAFSFRL